MFRKPPARLAEALSPGCDRVKVARRLGLRLSYVETWYHRLHPSHRRVKRADVDHLDAEVRRLKAEGRTTDEIMQALGVGRRFAQYGSRRRQDKQAT